MSNSFLRGTAWLSISSFLFLAVGYVAQVLIGRTLSPEDYGTFGVAVYALNIIEFVVITGLAQSLSKFISERPAASRSVIRHSILAQIVLAIVVSLPLWILAPHISVWFGDPRMTLPLRIVAIILPFYSIRGLLQGILTGQREFSSVSKVTLIIAIVKFVLIMVALSVRATPTVILLAYLLGSLAGAVYGWRFLKPIGRTEIIPRGQFYSFAFSLTTFLIIFPLFINLDVFIVKRLITAGYLAGVYVAVSTLARMPFYLFTGLLLTLLPTVAHLKQSAFDQLQKTVREVNRYTLLLLLPMIALICVTADSLLPLLFGRSYQDGGNALRILIVGVALLVLFRIFTTVLVGVASPTQVTITTVTMILLDIGLNLFLIPRYGITGAALASTLSSAFGFVFAAIQLKRHRLMLIDWPSAKRSTPAALISAALVIYHPANVMLLVQLLAAGFVYFGLLFVFKEIQPRDCERIRALLKRDQAKTVPIETQT